MFERAKVIATKQTHTLALDRCGWLGALVKSNNYEAILAINNWKVYYSVYTLDVANSIGIATPQSEQNSIT